MNNKKVNWLYLIVILAHYSLFAVVLILARQGKMFNISIIENLLLGQAMIFVPALCFVVASRGSTGAAGLNDLLGFHKIKISTFFMVILFTLLLSPLTSLINSISMLFVDNTVSAMSSSVLQMPFPIMLFFIGIFGPFSEEFVFRGIIFRGYKNSGSILQAIIWSAILFGFMHLNFNQAAYATVLGIMLALAVEATGSLWASIIMHIVFNSPSVITMYLADFISPGFYSAANTEEMLTQSALISLIGPELIMAVASTSIAICVLVWIAKNENRTEHLRNIWIRRKETKRRIVSIPLIVALILCLIYMIMVA
ncbi:MAG: CPBP family intramembrane metalloprotease [Clostridiales bacterium]|nr:CPBP family intramembrane metalloprotease [Clostridiales bacterium]